MNVLIEREAEKRDSYNSASWKSFDCTDASCQYNFVLVQFTMDFSDINILYIVDIHLWFLISVSTTIQLWIFGLVLLVYLTKT